MERMGCENHQSLEDELKTEELRLWASFRGQTLSRTGSVSMLFSILDLHANGSHF